MSLVVLLGGARAGKSALAVRLVEAERRPVVFVATAEARDADMADRIRRHRVGRPRGWRTIEEPVELRAALADAADDACVVVDCLSLWVANLIERGWDAEAVEGEGKAAAAVAAGRAPLTVAVTNEVGLGVVPANPLGRAYRDLLGRVNAAWVAVADEAALVVAGRLLRLEVPEAIFRG